MINHYTESYLLNPVHRITVIVIGAGGNGSKMLSNLASIDQGLQALGHPGLSVGVIDDDTVTEANVGRQLFSPADVGKYKADVMVNRINRFYGLDWISEPARFTDKSFYPANIIISCVDNLATRKLIAKLNHKTLEPEKKIFYWLDMGNGNDYGQIILSTKQKIKSKNPDHTQTLPDAFTLFPELKKRRKESNEPSCSLAEALLRQDLFINTAVALHASDLLWKLFTHGKLDYHGAFINMKTLQVNKLKIKTQDNGRVV